MAKKSINPVVLGIAEKICTAQGELGQRQWGTMEHTSLVRNLACDRLRAVHAAAAEGKDEASKLVASIKPAALDALIAAFRPAFMSAIQDNGAVTNAAQFGGALRGLDTPLLPKATAKELSAYD